MSNQIVIPDIGQEGAVEVIEVMVKPGDNIDKDTPLITLESDKASMEIPSPQAGLIERLLVNVGDKVTTGSPILLLAGQEQVAGADSQVVAADSQTQAQPAQAKADEAKASDPAAPIAQEQTINVPDLGNVDAVEIIEINIAVGDQINENDPLITLESDKASMDVPSPIAGEIKSIAVKVGDKVKAGDSIAIALCLSGESATTTAAASQPTVASLAQSQPATAPQAEPQPNVVTPPAAPVVKQQPSLGVSSDSIYASPSMRRLARECGVDLAVIQGTGRKGRITRDDVTRFIKNQMTNAAPSASALPSMPEIDFSEFGAFSTQPLTRIKRLSGEYLHRNWVVIPHVTQFDEADITHLEAFRKACKPRAEKAGVKLTILPFLIKAAVAALKQFPTFNASLSADAKQLILKQYYHIGVAVDTEEGLVVPVIKNADQKGLFQLAREITELSQKARDKKLSPDEIKGSCFTLSSLGGIGGTYFTPIINAPDVAILGISKASHKPFYQDGQWLPKLRLPLSLSYDHRVIDGALAAQFIVQMGAYLSDIRQLLL